MSIELLGIDEWTILLWSRLRRCPARVRGSPWVEALVGRPNKGIFSGMVVHPRLLYAHCILIKGIVSQGL